ncbi:666_t:CDS:2, partial [Funneliformis mosseae]
MDKIFQDTIQNDSENEIVKEFNQYFPALKYNFCDQQGLIKTKPVVTPEPEPSDKEDNETKKSPCTWKKEPIKLLLTYLKENKKVVQRLTKR